MFCSLRATSLGGGGTEGGENTLYFSPPPPPRHQPGDSLLVASILKRKVDIFK